MKAPTFVSLLALGTMAATANAALWVDFNSNQSGGGTPVAGDPTDTSTTNKNAAGYSSYHARHETPGDFITATYNTTFANTGPASVGVTPSWSNTTDSNVQQSIGRGAANDAQYTNPGDYSLELVTDWIGIDTRTGNGGNGNFDGAVGTPTWIDISLSSLPAGDYSWLSIHHDTENVFTNFNVYVDGVFAGTGFQSDSSTGGNPDSGALRTDGPASTFSTTFSADGSSDVVVRFEPLSGELGNAVHNQLFALNGFQLEQVPEPSVGLLGLLGAALLGLRRRR